jgi:hypothetical protein
MKFLLKKEDRTILVFILVWNLFLNENE